MNFNSYNSLLVLLKRLPSHLIVHVAWNGLILGFGEACPRTSLSVLPVELFVVIQRNVLLSKSELLLNAEDGKNDHQDDVNEEHVVLLEQFLVHEGIVDQELVGVATQEERASSDEQVGSGHARTVDDGDLEVED